MNGVKLEETKKDLYERSPFIDMPMLRPHSKAEIDKYFDEDLEALPSPRLIKTHYPFELLPPNLLDTCKVTWSLSLQGCVHFTLFRCSMFVATSRTLQSLTSTMSLSWRAMTSNVTSSHTQGSFIISKDILLFHSSFTANISSIRDIYLPGLCLHGGFFEMLESGWKRRNHPNIMFYW